MNDEGIRALMAAICIQAALDYKVSIKGKWLVDTYIEYRNGKPHKSPTYGATVWHIRKTNKWIPARQYGIDPPAVYVKFFKSAWFRALSGLENSDYIIDQLKKTEYREVKKWSF